MAPAAEVIHEIPGRVRFKIPDKRHDTEFFNVISRGLEQLQGVETVHANPITASVLVLHHNNPGTIRRLAEEKGLFHLRESRGGTLLRDRFVSGMRRLNDQIARKTNGQSDLNSLLMVGLMAAGTIQMLRSHVWPAGFTLFWYATTLAKEKRSNGSE